jgi:hypothetical protein
VMTLECEVHARQAAQRQVADLQERIARADVDLQRAVLAEREDCAKVCEYRAMALDYSGNQYVRDHAALDCARSIRARGKHDTQGQKYADRPDVPA